jgi:hypothetical protein
VQCLVDPAKFCDRLREARRIIADLKRAQELRTHLQGRRFGASWRDAIVSVITSSLPNKVDIDNSQIIVSTDEKHVYRLILTTSTTYYNGKREFNIYLVEALRPYDYGNKETTLLLKGLEIVCRFRFMFLEEMSQFSGHNVLAMNLERLPELAHNLLRELNFLRRDAQEVGLDQPNEWRAFVSWEVIQRMSGNWEPLEKTIRATAGKIVTHKGDRTDCGGMDVLRSELSTILSRLDESIQGDNRILIKEMTEQLKRRVETEHKA